MALVRWTHGTMASLFHWTELEAMPWGGWPGLRRPMLWHWVLLWGFYFPLVSVLAHLGHSLMRRDGETQRMAFWARGQKTGEQAKAPHLCLWARGVIIM